MTNTKEIISKAGTKFVLKDSITYGDHLDIKEVYLSEKTPAEMARDADKKGIELVIVSIDGKTENIYEEFKKLPYGDVDEIIVEVKNRLSPKKA